MRRKVITRDELDVILRKHKLWLEDDPAGERANLYGADLYGANLTRADLTRADLYGADLTGADLTRADLTRANLTGADLTRADLYGADLTRANLTGADLYGADLYGANLTGADLYGANLTGADLTRANLTSVRYPIACPEKGSFTAFKKAGGHIVELLIPDDALRSSASSRKCRCSKAMVVSITNLDGSATDLTTVPSSYDSTFVYNVGDTVSVDNFDPDRWKECAPGIHFFITRQEAVDYIL